MKTYIISGDYIWRWQTNHIFNVISTWIFSTRYLLQRCKCHRLMFLNIRYKKNTTSTTLAISSGMLMARRMTALVVCHKISEITNWYQTNEWSGIEFFKYRCTGLIHENTCRRRKHLVLHSKAGVDMIPTFFIISAGIASCHNANFSSVAAMFCHQWRKSGRQSW